MKLGFTKSSYFVDEHLGLAQRGQRKMKQHTRMPPSRRVSNCLLMVEDIVLNIRSIILTTMDSVFCRLKNEVRRLKDNSSSQQGPVHNYVLRRR